MRLISAAVNRTRQLMAPVRGSTLLLYGLRGASSRPGDVEELAATATIGRSDVPYEPAVLRARFEARQRLFVLRHGGEPVSFGWFLVGAPQLVVEVGATLVGPPRCGWIVDCVTPERHRGRGHYAALIASLVGLDGVAETLIYCSAANRPSRRGIEKAGFALWYTITRRFGRLSWAVVSVDAAPVGVIGR